MMSQYSRVSKIYSKNPLRLPDSDITWEFIEKHQNTSVFRCGNNNSEEKTKNTFFLFLAHCMCANDTNTVVLQLKAKGEHLVDATDWIVNL